MSLLFLDERSQLALLLAASVAGCGALAGCNERSIEGIDGGRDLRGEARVPDVADALPDAADVRGPELSDRLPPDGRDAAPPDVDPLPDSGDELVADMLPPDAGPDENIADPLPSDSGPRSPARGSALPLAPELKVRLSAPKAHRMVLAATRGEVRYSAYTTYRSPGLRFSWWASGGSVIGDGPQATWRPPAAPGRYLIQVTVADGERALAVDAITEEVR